MFGKPEKKWLIIVMVISVMTLSICLLFEHYFVWNYTHSLKPGFYFKNGKAYERGSVVLFCPDPEPNIIEGVERGFLDKGLCPCQGVPLIKKIEGVPGDRVRVSEEGVAINGKLLANSQRCATMKTARAIPYEETLGMHEYFVMTPHPNSYDSRYFGKVSDTVFQTTLQPFLVWE